MQNRRNSKAILKLKQKLLNARNILSSSKSISNKAIDGKELDDDKNYVDIESDDEIDESQDEVHDEPLPKEVQNILDEFGIPYTRDRKRKKLPLPNPIVRYSTSFHEVNYPTYWNAFHEKNNPSGKKPKKRKPNSRVSKHSLVQLSKESEEYKVVAGHFMSKTKVELKSVLRFIIIHIPFNRRHRYKYGNKDTFYSPQ